MVGGVEKNVRGATADTAATADTVDTVDNAPPAMREEV
jgi:hypothetical protein